MKNGLERSVTIQSVLGLIVFLSLATGSPARDLCRIDVIDADSGWPVPLVELRTVHNVRFISDNAGVVAFDLPELFGAETWFFVEGHGYEVPKDGFGMRGVRLTPRPGERLTVKVRRLLPAKRLGRVSGAGLFGESQKLGLHDDWTEQGILGCDSVQNAVHNGKLFWSWGDTALAKYPLGIFNMIGATTELQPLESFEPPVRLRYNYFTDSEKRVREIARMPGEGPTWLSGFVSLPDKDGQQHLVAHYIKVKGMLTAYESGLCVWDETESQFKQHRVLWKQTDDNMNPPTAPDGHPVFWTDAAGERWVLFGDPFPWLKCRPTFEAWESPESWERIESQKTVSAADTEAEIRVHRGAIAWNAYRKKWVTVLCEIGGAPSGLGELWYAEAKQPTGPWGPAVKVVTHDNYTFYNPQLHPEFTAPDSPILLFEATYTQTFADKPYPTPRYDYNQVLYRLDLDDPKLLGAKASK